MLSDRFGVLEAALPKQRKLIARSAPTLSAGLQMALPILRECRHDVHGFNPRCDSRRLTTSNSLPAKETRNALRTIEKTTAGDLSRALLPWRGSANYDVDQIVRVPVRFSGVIETIAPDQPPTMSQ
jgi:hypothetical protein